MFPLQRRCNNFIILWSLRTFQTIMLQRMSWQKEVMWNLSTANIWLNTWLEYFGFLSPWSLLPKCHEESYMLVCVWPSLNPPLLHQAVRVSRRSEMPTSRLLKGSLPVLRDGSLLSPLSYIIISFYFSFTFPPLYLPHSLRHARPLPAAVFCSCFLCSLYACSLSFLPKPSSF